MDVAALCERFNRLFMLYLDKNVTTDTMFNNGFGVRVLGGVVGEASFNEMILCLECISLVENFSLQDNAYKRWSR